MQPHPEISPPARAAGLPIVLTLLFPAALMGAALAAQDTPAAERPKLSREEQERFLLEAEIVGQERIPVGVTGSVRVTLSDGTLTHDAHVQTVDFYRRKLVGQVHTKLDFKDSYKFNIAAYRLDKLLDLEMVPVTVGRTLFGKRAAVAWWIDDVMMDGAEKDATGARPPNMGRWNAQKLQGWVFQNLIYNTDPNPGNLLIDESWRPWLIDFTRAFRRWNRLMDVVNLTKVPRGFYQRLRELDPEEVRSELGPYLTKPEMGALLARRDLLVEHFEALIAERGEAAVFVDDPVP